MLSLIVIALALPSHCLAQKEQLQNPVVTKPLYGAGVDGRIIEIPLPTAELVGSTYLHDDWRLSDLVFFNRVTLKEHWMRYDLVQNRMEIKNDGVISVVNLEKISSGNWLDPQTDQRVKFVNNSEFKLDGTPILGILEVLADDTIALVKRTHPEVLEANYVPQLASGRRDHRIQKMVNYYLLVGQDLKEIDLRWKKSLTAFNPHEEAMTEFLKENKLSFKNESDLIQAVHYFNTISE